MWQGAQVLRGSEVVYTEIAGYPAGTATIAECVDSTQAHGLRVGFIRMRDVVIPRGERGEEALYVVSGSVTVIEGDRETVAGAGDTIFLARGADPVYRWSEDTVIFYALTPPA